MCTRAREKIGAISRNNSYTLDNGVAEQTSQPMPRSRSFRGGKLAAPPTRSAKIEKKAPPHSGAPSQNVYSALWSVEGRAEQTCLLPCCYDADHVFRSSPAFPPRVRSQTFSHWLSIFTSRKKRVSADSEYHRRNYFARASEAAVFESDVEVSEISTPLEEDEVHIGDGRRDQRRGQGCDCQQLWHDSQVLRHPRDVYQNRPLHQHRCWHVFAVRARGGLRTGRRWRGRPRSRQLRAVP